MTGSNDPWLLLNQLARNGLRSVRVRVTIKGREEVITDRALEIALAQLETDKPIEVPPELRLAVKAAIQIALIEPEEAAEIAQKAQAGDAGAQALFQALILRHLASLRPGARALAEGLARGDAASKVKAENIRRCATTPGPKQFDARTAFFVLRDSIQELKDKARQAAKVAAQSSEPEPEETEESYGNTLTGTEGADPPTSPSVPDLFPTTPAPGVH